MLRLILLIAIFTFTTTTSCLGQLEEGLEFKICGKTYEPSHPLAWSQLKTEYGNLLNDGNYDAIYRDLISKLNSSPKQRDEQIHDKFLEKSKQVLQSEVSPQPMFEIYKHVDEDLETKLFLFRGGPFQIELPASEKECGDKTEQLDELRYLSSAFVKIDEIQKFPARIAVFNRISEVEEQFDRYLFEGFPMFPWEAYVNSRFLAKEHIAEGPPNHQLVIFHPGVAVETDTQNFSAAEPDLALIVEPFGWIYYPKDEKFKTWWGISTIASIKDDDGFGVGVVGHYKNFSLGVTWHDSDKGGTLFDDDPFILLSMDLYQFVSERYRSYESYEKRFRELKTEYLMDIFQ